MARASRSNPPWTVHQPRDQIGHPRWTLVVRLAVILAWPLSLAGCGSAPSSDTKEPLIWDGPLAEKVDYLVGDGHPALLRYNFENPSKEIVRFIEAKASCRCTSIALAEGDFPPGSSGTITFQLEVDGTSGHLVSTQGYIGYSCGERKYAHLVQLAVNKRRPLEWEPEFVDLDEVAAAGGGYCEGRLTLTRYTAPGRPFDDCRISLGDLAGDVSIEKDEGWGPDQRDGGYVKSSRKLRLRTKPNAPSSGTARLNLVSGDPPIGKNSVAIRWSRQNLASMEPRTILISKDRPKCRIQIVSHKGQPRNVSWKLPSGFEIVRTDNPEQGSGMLVDLSLNKAAPEAKYPLSEPFTVIVDYDDRSVELAGTVVVLSPP